MLVKLLKLSLLAFLFLYAPFSLAYKETPVRHPFYFGAIAGYGSTTWDGLVPSEEKIKIQH
ncbi:Uncharacterised protein [Legionella sainthelensi]|uniref:hypothetical protein n=1 Tax=Legionella sainthelensi TaxID=28087 RepID=UPI000F6D476D|nr:hypothetical protein [Legionella sainthelensi]VEB35040.1 Uncharacterised protein [Legionella sainthelensi]